MKQKERNFIHELTKDIMINQAKIIDDFFRAYCSSFDKEYFLKLKKEEFRRITLIMKRDGLNTEYSFKLSRGKLPKIKKQNK